MAFLSDLGSIIGNQFSLENTHSLDGPNNQYGQSYSGLGDFASTIDQSAQRYYLEDGFIRDLRPRSRSVLFQQPDIYVVIKKRMFSTLSDNCRLDLLEKKERILIAATKKLFQNKCKLLSAYEQLTKIENQSIDSGRFNSYLAPQLFSLLDTSSALFNGSGNASVSAAIDTLRRVISYAQPGELSSWTTNDYDAVWSTDVGEGPGTFELTNVASLNTTASTEWGGGSATLTLEDPYNLLTITQADIDQALSDVTSPIRANTFYRLTSIQLGNTITDLKNQLTAARQARFASPITFDSTVESVSGQLVTAILDNEGKSIKFQYSFHNLSGSVEISPQFLAGNDPLGLDTNDQLTPSEKDLFSQIISNIYTQNQQASLSQTNINLQNQLINYARNRMRLFFNGKFIIQPMDTISIWMTTRTVEDPRLPGGFEWRQNIGGSPGFDAILSGITSDISAFNSFTGGFSSGPSYDDLERYATVGPDMPKWLWNQFRQSIISQPTGPCIFSGIVGKGNSGVSGRWSDGKWTINVQCEDHTGYFHKGMINLKPAADVFNSSIYDPLTPFDLSFDASSGAPITSVAPGDIPPLLPENQKLFDSGLLTFRSGHNKGQPATAATYVDTPNELAFGDFTSVLHDPEGLVYRWKQGIQSLTENSRPSKDIDVDQERAVCLTNSPFAGQDIMNVISLLITGVPYNYQTFIKAALANVNSTDIMTNTLSSSSYLQGLQNDIQKQNEIWGNFVPFKNLIMNPAASSLIYQQITNAITLNTNLRQKLQEQANAQDELTLRLSSMASDPRQLLNATGTTQSSASTNAAQTKLLKLSTEIQQLQQQYNLTVKDQLACNPDVGFSLIGNDISSNPTLSSIGDVKSTPGQQNTDSNNLKDTLATISERKFWQVKANEDKNLFIVDDQYDKNLDIQGFERKLGGKIELFNSVYSKIGDQIDGIKKLLGLECFADTQGHIRIRPPGYNKMPSSVFYQMFKDRDTSGIKVFPDFLEKLYFNQIKGLFKQIEIVEDEIRLRAIALGCQSDDNIINLIMAGGAAPGQSFAFLTQFYGDGTIGTNSIQYFLTQSCPDFSDPNTTSALNNFDSIQATISQQAKLKSLFPPAVQATAISYFDSNASPDVESTLFTFIQNRLRIKTGKEPPTLQDLFSSPSFRRVSSVSGPNISAGDRLAIIDTIATLISERQTQIRVVTGAIANLQAGVRANAPDIETTSFGGGGFGGSIQTPASISASSALSSPALNRRSEIPQPLEHLIEYEDDDDLGPGSGRRYVLTADRIVSLTITENIPQATMVTVKGMFGQGAVDGPSSFNTSGGGNMISSAYAVDYDMWYQYGFTTSQVVDAPFLSDPDSQCAPYAVATLLKFRENILQGQAEITGYNEYYQPGDVVYIEDRDLLFYVKSVQHSFSYGRLSTTLDLNYGHCPGDYIPTMLDIAGQVLYASKNSGGSQFRSNRTQMQGAARPLGALIFNAQPITMDDGSSTRIPPDTDTTTLLLSGRFGTRNQNVLSSSLFTMSSSLNNTAFMSNKVRLKIVYYLTVGVDPGEMQKIVGAIVNWFKYPTGNQQSSGIASPLPNNSFSLSDNDIVVEKVDMTDPQKQTRQIVYPSTLSGPKYPNTQGPSSFAVQAARVLDVSDSTPKQFATILGSSVIDLFIDYNQVGVQTGTNASNTSTCTPTISNTGSNSQSGQAAAAAIQNASVQNVQSNIGIA